MGKVFQWEAIGFIFVVITGSLLHFCFEWSGCFKPAAPFCAVNESVWEHLKLVFWPGLAYASLEYVLWGKIFGNFWFGKAISLYFAALFTVIAFYSYTAVLGTHILFIDIALFIASALIAQVISYRIIVSETDFSAFSREAAALILLLAAAFCLFTFLPPKLELFRDPRNGAFGIPVKK